MVRRQVRGQPSLFGVAARDPMPEDLAGLLAGPAGLRRMGRTVQISVRVDAAWRVHALLAELALRRLPGGWEPVWPDSAPHPPPGPDPAGEPVGEPAEVPAQIPVGFMVRTAFTTRLGRLADAWCVRYDLRKRPPPGLHLHGPALRLWTAAAGTGDADGYLLGLGTGDEPIWPAVGAALSAAGLTATLLAPTRPGAAGPAYRIAGRRRLARLAELVGDPPASAPPGAWPVPPEAGSAVPDTRPAGVPPGRRPADPGPAGSS